MDLTALAAPAVLIWFSILILPWRPWGTREVLDADRPVSPEDLGDTTALIPARNEAEVIETTLSGLEQQGRNLKIVLVDDQSTDSTAALAGRTVSKNLLVIQGKQPPPGWSGKLWALEQGLAHVRTPLLLLMDADIRLDPGLLAALRKMMREKDLRFVSLMASLRMSSFWERLLMPPFIYFFKFLYPFSRSNSPRSKTAAAAGGCILMETRILREIGGFGSLRSELIDDCALAGRIKARGHGTWIGLTHSVHSLRRYEGPAPIWNMVARTAYTKLNYSPWRLVLCTLAMVTVFWLPVAGLVFPDLHDKLLSALALAAMALSYRPTLRFYGLASLRALTLPLAAALYLAMTWTSAFRYLRGERSQWKGRSYARTQPASPARLDDP